MLRKIIIGIVALVVIVVGGLWAAATFFLDSATIAQQVKKEVASRYNRDLVFNGELRTNFFPKIQIVLPETSLSFEGRKDPQFMLENASVGVAVIPLLSGNIQFDEVIINGLRGSVNVKRIAQKINESKTQPTAKVAEDKTAEESFIKTLEVAGVEVTNAAFNVYGVQGDKVYTISGMNLKTGALGLKGTTPISFNANFSEKTQSVSGSLSVSTTAAYDLESLDVQLSDLKTTLKYNQNKDSVQASLETPSVKYVKSDVEINNAKASLSMGSGLSAQLSAKQLTTQAAMKDWMVEGVSGSVNLDKVTSASVSGNFSGGIEVPSVKSDRLTGAIQTKINNMAVSIPFNGMISVQVPQESASVSLNGEFDKEMFSVNANVKGFSKPTVTGQVQLNALTVDKWIAATPAKTASGIDWSPVREAIAQKVERLTALDAANTNISVKLNKLKYQKLSVNNIGTTVKLQNGTLGLNNISAQICGGTIAGHLSLTALQQWGVDLTASKVDSRCLLEGLSMPDQLTGSIRASMKIAGTGLDETAIKKTAKGSMSAQIDRAVLRGVSLEKVASAVRAKNPAGFVISPNDSTQFSALNATASIGNGTLSVTSLNGKSSVAEVSGRMQIGLINSSLSGQVSAKLATSADGRRVTVPIALSGTVQEPKYGVDIAAAIVSNVENIIKNEPEKLIEGLGRLLRR